MMPVRIPDPTFIAMRAPNTVVLTVDAVITDAGGRILLMQRGTEPFRGTWVLPGGIVEPGETVEQACVREVEEEVGLKVRVVRLIGVYSTPGRDPRGAFVSLAFHATIAGGALRVTEEARAHRWLEAGEELPLGFDHARIVADLRAQQG
jgi:8-oxo-dGTP diphosphatase